ncbi:hypothetical protein O181_003527 [Austropuccinia psidii MF-1]|uniref:Uncharacterized protein n=1 Tax=Austropuccinia psidii MF-1 TaxID=1389203 RepID=A0A9Q3GEZ5_9BASI|nr:hypothetical protein [Austropuccinia psidii MF-1]
MACTGKITIITPGVISKGKFPKAVDKELPEDREGLFRTRIPVRGHLGHRGGWQDTEGNHTHSAIHVPIKQKHHTRGLEGYVSSSSVPPTRQRYFPREHGQQKVQPRIPLGRTWIKVPENMSQRDTLQRSYGNHQRMESHQEVQTPGGKGNQDEGATRHYPINRRTAEPERASLYSFSVTRSRPTQLSTGFKPFRHLQISGQESPFSKIPGSLQKKPRIKAQKQDFFLPKAERVRPNDPEAVGIGERSTQ